MLERTRCILAVAVPALLAAACSTAPEDSVSTVSVPPAAGTYKIGVPYEINDTWYYPHEQPDYDETGIASWYGPNFEGKLTASGEVFDSTALTAAHTTLPMPVNVRVTNLENGRSLVLRVNDRGPYVGGRIIDVSAHAAELLGFYEAGTAKVRVTFLARADAPNGTPDTSDSPSVMATALPAVRTEEVQTASLAPIPAAAAVPAAPPPEPANDPPPSLAVLDNAPAVQVSDVTVPAATRLYVQAGTFDIAANAERLKSRLAAAGKLMISPIDRKGQRLYRVRIGPFDDVGEADAALAKLVGLGNSDAKIVVDQ